ncbi:MAG: type II and III secretion system protein [Phycisphaerales bacterium]|nr:type II and III secretion system protein [Phycisphaerales bacterium]
MGITANSSGLGLGGSGLTVGILSGNVDASINAFASNRRVKILSTPILVARSGGAAEIQVGTDVPIITSQRAASNQSGSSSTDILQSIEYRSTGVILRIEPIVFSDDRIDLTISQEVSSTIDVQNSSISSPTISNRSINTQLSLEDGETAVLGGLIQESRIHDVKGIPILKDIPGIGHLFSNDNISVDRTELVVLITAYVLRGQADKDQFVNHLSQRVDRYMSDESRFETLLPRQF